MQQPFQGGNGMVARGLASVGRAMAGILPPVVTLVGKKERIYVLGRQIRATFILSSGACQA
jgi:hypothetical protein